MENYHRWETYAELAQDWKALQRPLLDYSKTYNQLQLIKVNTITDEKALLGILKGSVTPKDDKV